MGGFGTRMALRSLAAVASVVVISWLALWYFIPAPPHELTIAAGIKGGAFEHIANRYKARLARHHVTLHFRFGSAGESTSAANRRLEVRVSGACSCSAACSTAKPHPILCPSAALAPPHSGFSTAGRRRSTVCRSSGESAPTSRSPPAISSTASWPPTASSPATWRLGPNGALWKRRTFCKKARLTWQFCRRSRNANAPSIQALLRDPKIPLMNVTQAEAITRLFPTLSRLVLPQGVIDLQKNNIPPNDVNLIGSTTAFVVRKDMHPELIYLLAQVMKEVHSGGGVFQRPGEFPSLTDPELPMAEEAIDYYRNGPSLLRRRHPPFWMINYASAWPRS